MAWKTDHLCCLSTQTWTAADIVAVRSWPSIHGKQSSIFWNNVVFLFDYLNFALLKQQLPLVFSATITGDRWIGEALLPWSFFPPNINKMNSYAIHGSGEERTYEALYPIPKQEIVEGQKPNL